ncbi:MAG: transaldolase [Gammaproteobacteria bacterium]|jgi:transaldolase
MNSLQAIRNCGQSVWLDYIRRGLLDSGGLQDLIDRDNISGVTSNPSIFEKAITQGSDYMDAIAECHRKSIIAPQAIYEQLAVKDIQDAADILMPVYESSDMRDGYVSFEVSPLLAYQTEATCSEARRLWKTVNRPNLMIKVPATVEGIPAIETLLGEGININVTLLFSREIYFKVVHAFINGLESFANSGGDIHRLASVASFFISRIDTAVDEILVEHIDAEENPEECLLASLPGKVAIANAKLAYQGYKLFFNAPRWQSLAEQGAQTQRLLWASTSNKNPNYRELRYVESLIGAETVNTLPPSTLEAFRDHGRVSASLELNLDEAYATIDTLQQAGISLEEITDQLTKEGVTLFADAYAGVLRAIKQQLAQTAA